MAQSRNKLIEYLYKDNFQLLFKVAFSITGKHELAQDMVQETFTLAILHYDKLKIHSQPDSWLLKTLHNLILNEQRRRLYEEISLHEAWNLSEEIRPESLYEILPNQLLAKEKELLILRFEQELTYQEIAKRLGISEDVCRKRVSRAISKCRRYMTGL